MKMINVRSALRRARGREQLPSVLVVGGPCDGQRVRDLVTLADGAWVMDRAYLCRPAHERGEVRERYDYVLENDHYVWHGNRARERE